MNWGCRASKIVYFVNFNLKWECYIVPEHLKTRIADEFQDVRSGASVIIIHTQNVTFTLYQPLTQMGA